MYTRGAPAIQRAVTTLRDADILLDEALFLGGIEKDRVFSEYKPHMFFDDQQVHNRIFR